jgi:16S rRNA (cytosine1402-N4)-methyltransferase
MQAAHVPVLLQETLDLWGTKPDGIYADLTLGMGGHSLGLLERFPRARLIALDWDGESLAMARERLREHAHRAVFRHANFTDLGVILRAEGVRGVDGILFDLGPSSFQILESGRGLTYRKPEPLDMRMSKELLTFPAAEILARASETELARFLVEYGEMPPGLGRRIAQSLAAARSRGALAGTQDLSDAVLAATSHQGKRAQVFQALRIAVNAELDNLRRLLDVCWSCAVPGGRVAGISFHSLEDRLVKEDFRRRGARGEIRILTRKPLRPGAREIADNARSRSARLRAAEKLA